MRLAWADRAYTGRIYIMPRMKAETRTEYTKRFFRDIQGLGNAVVYTVKGSHVVRRLIRPM